MRCNEEHTLNLQLDVLITGFLLQACCFRNARLVRLSNHRVSDQSGSQALHVKHARPGATVAYEETVLGILQHPHIIECYGSSEDNTKLWIEQGEMDLYDYVASSRGCRLPVDEVCAKRLSSSSS